MQCDLILELFTSFCWSTCVCMYAYVISYTTYIKSIRRILECEHTFQDCCYLGEGRLMHLHNGTHTQIHSQNNNVSLKLERGYNF